MKNIYRLFLLLCPLLATAQVKPSQEYLTHLKAAKSHGVAHIKTKKQLDRLVANKKLVHVKQRGYGYRVDKLTHSYSYLIPKGKKVLDDIARSFVQETGQNFFVVTSLTRTEEKQKLLRRSNINASSNESAHTFGASFDISYVRFNHKRGRNTKLENALEKVLKQYQKQGEIYFVKERKVNCFHIVVR